MVILRRTLAFTLTSLCFAVLVAAPVVARNQLGLDDIDVHTNDVLIPPPPPPDLATFGETSGPSQYMAGSVAVLLVLPESDGSAEPSSEDWTQDQIDEVTQEVQEALDWWVTQLPQARLSFELDVQVVPTAYEPVTHGLRDEGLWIGDVLGRMGYDGSYFEQAYHATYDLRRQKQTDWATLIFIANSDNSGTGRFEDRKFGYAYINGPFMVLTSDGGSYGTNRLASVVAHEMGHIFGALDQYSAAQTPCNRRSGYLNEPTSNSQIGDCPTSLPSIMLSPISAFNSGAVDPSAQAQLGYRDSDGNGIIDPLDTTPTLELDPAPAVVTAQQPRFTGRSIDTGYPSPRHHIVSINAIERIEYRVDGGDWQAAFPDDGAFDSADEAFYLEAPLYDGSHLVEFRAINSVGAVSPIKPATVEVSDVGLAPTYAMQAPKVSNTNVITLSFDAPADTQAIQVSDDPLFEDASWQPYVDTLTHTLGTVDDEATAVYVRFQDALGYISPVYTQQLLIDTQPPVGQVSIKQRDTLYAVINVEDPGSGIQEIEIQVQRDTETWEPLAIDNMSQTNGSEEVTQLYQTDIPLPPQTTRVRVRFRDVAGNMSAYISAQSSIFLPLIITGR